MNTRTKATAGILMVACLGFGAMHISEGSFPLGIVLMFIAGILFDQLRKPTE